MGVNAPYVPAIPIIRHCAIPHPTLPRLRGREAGTSPAMMLRVLLLLRAAEPKGCIWSNFWRNGATQKWRHRVFFIAVQRICAFAGMPGARRHDESVTKGRNTASSGGWRQ